MYIICENTNSIINMDNIACIGYEKYCEGRKLYYAVFAYTGNIDNHCAFKCMISKHELKAQAQYVISYIKENIQNGADMITI